MKKWFLALLLIAVSMVIVAIPLAAQDATTDEELEKLVDTIQTDSTVIQEDTADIVLTREDSIQIIHLVFQHAFKPRQDITINTIIYAPHLNPEWIPEIEGRNFILITDKEERQKKAETEGSFLYYRIGEIKVKGQKVHAGYGFAYEPWSMIASGGTGMEFEKVDGEWVGKVTISWVS